MQFTIFPIGRVHIDKPSRDRQQLGDLTGLKKSLSEVGLLNPIIITKDGQLIAGERRFTAAKELGWTDLPVQFKEDLTDLELKRIEHDENAHRLDLTWQEKAEEILRFHELSTEIEGANWTLQQTAESLGYRPTQLFEYIRVAESLREGDAAVTNAASFSVAAGICARADARKRDEEEEEIKRLVLTPAGATPTVSLPADPVLAKRITVQHVGVPILLADFTVWAQSYSGPRFNLIHCDFPYGQEATDDKHKQYNKELGSYEDSPEIFDNLVSTLVHYQSHFIADSAHILFWFQAKRYRSVYADLASLGPDWFINPVPLVWFRSDNVGMLPDARRYPRQVYETAFLCTRGDRFLYKAKANLIPAATTKQFHMSEKPQAMLEHFLSMLVDGTSTVLDPTCGSGNALIVAKRLGAKTVLGIEKDEGFYGNAQRNWRQAFNGSGADADEEAQPGQDDQPASEGAGDLGEGVQESL